MFIDCIGYSRYLKEYWDVDNVRQLYVIMNDNGFGEFKESFIDCRLAGDNEYRFLFVNVMDGWIEYRIECF